MKGRVLIVAGSDSGGGAGIQADIKTVTALGGYAATAVTALTAQDTSGVHGIHPVPADFVALQMRVCLGDIGADAIKIGMVNKSEVIDAVADVLESAARGIPLVIDPVMIAKTGDSLLDPTAACTLKRRLLLLADILTPNLPEAEALTGLTIRNLDDMRHAAHMLHTLGPKAVLLKGGHLDAGATVRDLLASDDGEEIFESERVHTRHTHGTGCTLASAIAVGLAQGLALRSAVMRAREYLLRAIHSAPGYGRGHGPLDHAHTMRSID